MVVVEILLNEFADPRQRFARIQHQIFVVHFHVIAAHRLSVAASFAHDPAPENCGRKIGARAIPGQRANPSDAVQGSRDVAAIANNVDNQRVRHESLDQRQITQVERRALGPARDALFAGDCIHHDAEEVAGILALVHDALIDLSSVRPVRSNSMLL